MLMNEPTQPAPALDSAVPQAWRDAVRERLAAGERVLAALEIDLDARLRFGDGLVVVTDRRVAARAPGETAWREWPLRDDLLLRKRDHAGVGTLELVDTRRRIDHWCFTLARDASAQRLIESLELALVARASGDAPPPAPARCPRCQAVLPRPGDDCPACAPEPEATPPSTAVLVSQNDAHTLRFTYKGASTRVDKVEETAAGAQIVGAVRRYGRRGGRVAVLGSWEALTDRALADGRYANGQVAQRLVEWLLEAER